MTKDEFAQKIEGWFPDVMNNLYDKCADENGLINIEKLAPMVSRMRDWRKDKIIIFFFLLYADELKNK